MSAIAIIGGALASALLSRVFGKILDGDDQKTACAKEPFQVAIEQAAAKPKGEGLAKASGGAEPSAAPNTDEMARTQSLSGAPALAAAFDSHFNQSRISQPAGADFGFPAAPPAAAASATAPAHTVPKFRSNVNAPGEPAVAIPARKPSSASVKQASPAISSELVDTRHSAADAGSRTAPASPAGANNAPHQADRNKDESDWPGAVIGPPGMHESLHNANHANRRASKLITSYSDPALSASGGSVSTAA